MRLDGCERGEGRKRRELLGIREGTLAALQIRAGEDLVYFRNDRGTEQKENNVT